MVYWIGGELTEVFGPFRLLQSHAILIILGLYLGFILTFVLLPRLMHRLPQDRGRDFAVDSGKAVGKPTGAGLIFIPIFVFVSLLMVPFGAAQLAVLVLVLLVMMSGYLDDRSEQSWSEYKKGFLDLLMAVAASVVLVLSNDRSIWLPFTNTILQLPIPVYMAVATVLIWASINITNCSDGVDGLSASLAMLGLVSLGIIMYFVVGHSDVARYLLLPHYAYGARWAVMVFTLAGCLAAYLWFNAYPSRVMMGDAGSRALGFFIGVSIMITGNPLLIFIVSSVLLVNGGTGLLKVALLRFLNIRILHNTRFPLHDHMREYRQWSNAQVLVKFAIIQLLITFGLFGAFLKIR
ncbi:MAG: phospho-N-acetylmuramoyl-pentapeptide-transferase [Spirochaeta sp.]|nr:phospho-N-acetylmuramoyl-pentapeptide-transferase [Spirochaeta sp.]